MLSLTALPAKSAPPNATPSCQASECVPASLGTLYRWYFTTAIAVALTAGATWGGWILYQIGMAGKFTGVSVHSVNAHGQAQIYGWMGLFIMGFAYHVFPRLWRGPLQLPALAPWVLMAVATGIVLRTVGMTSAGTWPAAVPLAVSGCLLQVCGIAMFAFQMFRTCLRGKSPIGPESGFLLGGLVWFFVMSLLDAFHTYTTMQAATRDELLWQIGTFQAPLRDLQIHGLALFMILGVSSRMIPAFYGRPVATARRGWWAVGLLSAAVAMEVVLFLAYRLTNNHVIAAFLMLPWLLLCTGVVLQVWPWKLWIPPARPDRSDKLIRTAYAWLALSLVMLLMLPVYQAAVKLAFSHAYYGAIRHAITVGFVSQMILGMSARLVPAIRGIPGRRLSTLHGPFILVNVGCFLRVSLQTITDWYAPAFSFVGLSAVFEIAGLAWWGGDLLRAMWGRKTQTA